MNAVSFYLNSILAPSLRKLGVSEEYILYTLGTINRQMSSLLRHWDDQLFRKAVLITGLEEGSYYEPAGKIDVRCFVVVTIRNSPIETIQSDEYAVAGLKRALTNAEVKALTMQAVSYFNKQNFDTLCVCAKQETSQDVYHEALKKHPLSFQALKALAGSSKKAIDYPSVKIDDPYIISEVEEMAVIQDEQEQERRKSTTYDGYSSKIEPQLAQILAYIVTTPYKAFMSDSFKSVTRNYSVLLDVIEYLLTRECVFVTSNFYFKNGHVERRMNPLRAGHYDTEMAKNLENTSGLSPLHRSTIRTLLKAE